MRIAAVVMLPIFVLPPLPLKAEPHRAALVEAAREDLDAEDVVGGATVDQHAPRGAPGGHAWVSVVGYTRETETGARDVGGMFVVGLPLDRMARVGGGRSLAERPRTPTPPPARASPAPAHSSDATPPPPDANAHAATPAKTDARTQARASPAPVVDRTSEANAHAQPPARASPTPQPADATPTAAPTPTTTPPAEAPPPLALTRGVARAAVAAAWRAAGLGSDDARIDAIVSRARWSGLLPETRLRAIRWDDDHFYAPYASDPTATPRESTGARLGLEARLTWRLDRLLFADDEPSFERLRLDRQDARARVAGRTLEALFHWQRALLELRWANEGSRERVEAALRLAEAEAALDVLTDGWFGVWRSERDP
jgi:hypothetical protein